MAPPEQEKPASSRLDATREKLRNAGYTDTEISQILVARELGSPGPTPDSAPSQGVLSSGLSSVVAIGSYARGTAFTIRHDLLTVFDAAASASARVSAATMLVFKAAVISVLAYAGWQEWKQHIISATEIAAANARKAHAEECSARLKAVVDIVAPSKLNEAMDLIQRDCDPSYAAGTERPKKETASDIANEILRAREEFEAGHYGEAFRLAQKDEARTEAFELREKGALGTETSSALSHLAWVGLFVREYSKSLDASERAIKLATDGLWPATNKAHALMFLDRAAEAKALYLAHKGDTSLQKIWEKVISDDFAELRHAGITHPMMAEIEKELMTPGQTAKSVLTQPAAPRAARPPYPIE